MPTNDIGQDRFQARLTKELRIKGSMPAPVLAPEIVPVLIVEGDRVENQHLQREHRFACTVTLASVAGEYYYYQLWNPTGRNGVVVVEEFALSGSGSETFDFGYAHIALKPSLGVRASYCLDSRVPGRAPQVGLAEPLVGTDLGSGSIDVFGRITCPTMDLKQIPLGLVLTPGYGFSIWNNTVNRSVSGYVIWRERQLMDGELIGP